MNNTRVKVTHLTLLLVGVITVGTFGYHWLLGWGWLDSLYMTTITITTVGFGEVQPLDDVGRLLTVLLILASVGVFAFTLTALGGMVVEMQVGSTLIRKRMEKRIKLMHNHFIICGFGRTGQAVANQLTRAKKEFVVIKSLPEKIEAMRERNMVFVDGDATQDETLQRAGIMEARGLVASLGNDAENVYLVLSARQMAPGLTIVSWATSPESERKVLKAGANHALSPYAQGGLRIAYLLMTPHALEFLDHAMGGGEDIRLGEIEIGPASPLIGNSLKSAGIRRDIGVIIIGIRRANGRIEFNPAADEILNQRDILIGLGSQEQIERLRKMV